MNFIQIPDLESLGEFYMMPELPMIEFKKDKVRYSVTDIRLLNQVGIYVLETILNKIAENPDNETVTFIREGVNDSAVNVVRDIVMGIRYKIEKKGRNGYFGQGTFLVSAVDVTDTKMTFYLLKDHVGIVHDYIQSRKNKNENVNFYELVVEVADKRFILRRGKDE